MKSRKTILIAIIMLLSVLSLMLCACNPNDPPTPSGQINLDTIAESSDKTTIENNVKELLDVTISLPEATLNGAVATIDGKKVYKIAVSDSSVSCEACFDSFETTLVSLGWSSIDDAFIKDADGGTLYIVFQTESGTATTFDIFIYQEAVSENDVTYNYTITQPTKTVYAEGEALDLTGFKIEKRGSDGSNVVLVEGEGYTIDKSSFDTTFGDDSTTKEILLPYTVTGSGTSGTIILTVRAATKIDFQGASVQRVVVDYDGNSHSVDITMPNNAADYTIQYAVSTDGGVTFGEWLNDNPSFTDVGRYTVKILISKRGYNDFTAQQNVNINALTFDCGEMPLRGFDVLWDGQSHADTTVLNLPTGTLVEYRVDGGEWTTTSPSFTDVGTTMVNYRISKTGYTTIEQLYRCRISKADISVSIVNDTGYLYLPVFGGQTFTPNISGTQAGDSIKFSLDTGDEKVWSASFPSITASCTLYVLVERGATHEGSASAYLTYFPNEEAEIAGLNLKVKDNDGTNYDWAYDSGFCTPHFTGHNWSTDYIEVRTKVGTGEWSEWAAWSGVPSEIVTGPDEYHYEFKLYRKDTGYIITSGTMTVEWSLNEDNLTRLFASSDIERNISILTGESITLPTATSVSAELSSVSTMPAYKISVTDSSVTLSNYISALGTELQAKGWNYLDGTSIKECGDTDVYIMPAMETTGTETTFDFYVVYVTGV